MEAELTWRCTCGAFEARVDAAGAGRVVCYCKHCRAFCRALGRGDLIDAAGGTDYLQTVPHRLRVTKGAEHLKAMRLTRKGAVRWYADCCGTPLGNTLDTAWKPYLSVLSGGFGTAAALPDVAVRANRRGAYQRVPDTDPQAIRRMLAKVAARAAGAYFTGGVFRAPFFGPGGRPVVAPVRLDPEKRRAAYDGDP